MAFRLGDNIRSKIHEMERYISREKYYIETALERIDSHRKYKEEGEQFMGSAVASEKFVARYCAKILEWEQYILTAESNIKEEEARLKRMTELLKYLVENNFDDLWLNLPR
jgi:hypothetical protein